MKNAFSLCVSLFLMAIVVACGGASDSQEPVPLEINEVVFAHGLDDEMGPVDPGNDYASDETIYVSVQLKGNPKEGVVAGEFFLGDDAITSTSLDLAQLWQDEGLLFVVGGNTQVGFTVSHEDPFPVGDDYSLKLSLDGEPAGAYPFHVVAPEGAVLSELRQAVLARGATEDYEAIDPTETFTTDEEVYLVGQGDFASGATVEANWIVDGQRDEAGTRLVTLEEDVLDAGFFFSFLPEGGWPAGEQQVIVLIDGNEVASFDFSVSP